MFMPSDVSGIWGWWAASSITGVANGGGFVTWPDLSGSGNNLIAGTGITSAITYRTNIINGFPVVRIPGTTASDFFQTLTHNQSLQLLPSSLAVYSVYLSRDQSKDQTILMNGFGGQFHQTYSFEIGLNKSVGGNTTPSGWYFISGTGLTSSDIPGIQDHSSSFGFSPQPSNQFVLRSDRFLNNGTYAFGLNGTEVAASSLTAVTINNSGLLYVGATPSNTSTVGVANLNADVAEIIAYGYPNIGDQNHSNVIAYLLNKYGLGVSAGCTMYINSVAPPIDISHTPFSPTFISGLFGWYQSTNVTNSSSGVMGWPDLSGSGNNLFLNQSRVNAGQKPIAPVVQNNVLNGYPSIRFSGGGYLGTPTHNQSLEISPSSLSVYCVFSAHDTVNEQALISNTDISIPNNRQRNFYLGLNHNNTMSGWFYSWGNNTTVLGPPAYKYIEANSTTFGKAFQAQDQFMLRADLFTNSPSSSGPELAPSGAGFYFDRFGSQIAASSLATTNTVTVSNLLTLGYDPVTPNIFYGEIVEILCYNNNTVDSTDPSGNYYGTSNSHEQIIAYLTQKYFLGAVGAPSLFIQGTPPGVNTIDRTTTLYTTAPNASSTPASFSLYEHGKTVASGKFPLYLDNSSIITSGKSLYIAGDYTQKISPLFLYAQQPPVASSTPFRLFLKQTTTVSTGTKSTTLYTSTINHLSGVLSTKLFLCNPLPVLSGKMPLYIGGKGPPVSSVTVPLFVGNFFSSASSVRSLYIGSTLNFNSGISLFMARPETNTFPMFIDGKLSSSSSLNLSLLSASSTFKAGPLYVKGAFNQTAHMPLYSVSVPNPGATGLVSLFVPVLDTASNASGLYRAVPMWLGSRTQVGMNLFIATLPVGLPESEMPLYIAGPIHSGYLVDGVPFFVAQNNSFSSKQAKLFVRGLGGLNGGLIDQGNMPLYIDRWPANVVSMFIGGSGLFNRSAPMFISGVLNNTKMSPLYISGLANSGKFPMYINGPNFNSNIVTMAISGKPFVENDSILYTHGF